MRFLPLLLVAAGVCADSAGAQFTAASHSSLWAKPVPQTDGSCTYGYSDNTSENALGLTNGGQIAWFQGFGTPCPAPGPADTIVQIATANGQVGAGNGAPAGSIGGVYIYDDPGGDFTDPTDLTGADLVANENWTTCCPNTDTLEPVSIVGAVTDGFWLAGMATHAPGEFPAPMDTTTAPSMSRSWVTGSNTLFDPTNPGGGIGFFEMAALGFDAHWLIEGLNSGNSIETYCTAKSGLTCGLPAIDFAGVPDAGATSGFVISAQPARGNRTGLILYSCAGRANFPFQGGILCVNPAPLRRAIIVGSGGTNGQCDGVFALDWNAFASGAAGGNPDPCVMHPGQQVNTQWWGRDSVATGSFLSNALEFLM